MQSRINRYKDIRQQVSAILIKYDPIGIFFGTNTDEYDPEVSTILPKLRHCRSEGDILKLVYQEFVRWFGETAGPKYRYSAIAKEIWQAYGHQ